MSKLIAQRPFVHLLLTGALTLWASRAEASPLFELMGDTQGMGGLQARTVPGSASAAYFNPALLTETPAGLQMGFVMLSQHIDINLDGRPGPQYDVPANINSARRGDFTNYDDYALPTKTLEQGMGDGTHKGDRPARPRQGAGSGHGERYYLGFGFNVKALQDRLALGMNILIPLGGFTTINAFFNDEREQYFSNSLHPEMYSDRMTAPTIGFGSAFKVTDDLALGVGATLSLKALAGAGAYVVNTQNLADVLISMNTTVSVALAPHFGATYTLLDKRLRLSATAHSPSQMEFSTGFSFTLGTGIQQASGTPFILNYLPWRASAGAAYDLLHGAQTLTVAGTVLYSNWSTYVDRHGDSPDSSYPWANTLSPTLGARYARGQFSTLIDLSYVPTPVPLQTGRKNYVDNDRISCAVGGEYAFAVLGAALSVGLQFQPHFLLPRHQYKLPTPTRADGRPGPANLVRDELPDDATLEGAPFPGREGLQTNNPGWPGFGSGGVVLAGSAYLRATF